MDCLFCKIAQGEIPAKKRFENNEFFAFDDINPKATTHILLIPKKHVASVAALEESDEQMIGKLIMAARQIAKDVQLESYRLVFNSGKDAGQEVDHIHLHILGGNKLGPIA
jgi:histidine triad (HIT) family protein